MNVTPRCMAVGCENVFQYLEDAAIVLSCNSHFACYGCVNRLCSVCVCDACGETLDTYPIHYGCGCAYHEAHIPHGSGVGRCSWCKKADERQMDAPDMPSMLPEVPAPGLVSRLMGVLLYPWRRNAPETHVAQEVTIRPRLSASKMLRRAWTAEYLLTLHHYRGTVIHDAGIPWNLLPELGFTMEMFKRLGVDVRQVLRRYLYYMSREDMDELVRVNMNLSLAMVADAVNYLMIAQQMALTPANFISNLHHRVSEKTLVLLYHGGSHTLEAILDNRLMWLDKYPNAAKKLLPAIYVQANGVAQHNDERNKVQ